MFRVNDCIQFEGKEYIISEFLGQGGMGHVFLIKEKFGDSQFALKCLQHYLPDDHNYRSLINEWEKSQRISHKNTIKYWGYHDGLTDPRTPYLIVEYASDGTLEDFIKNQNSFLDEFECLNIFHQIIDGMEAVNEVLVHRDIKPDNIFIDKGLFKIADFGLAKIAEEKTRSKTFKGWGTEPYIAPEAYRAETNTIQMDMYSIGLVFYQIAGLVHAYGVQTDWQQAHMTAIPRGLHTVNNKISPKLSSVVNRLIAKKPSARFSSWNEVRQEIISSSQNTTEHQPLINHILQKKLSRDLAAEQELSQKIMKENELKRKSDLIEFQFNTEIIQPVRDFICNFNDVSGRESAIYMSDVSKRGDMICGLNFDGKNVKISLHKINESDVIRTSRSDPWGEGRIHEIKPTLYGKPVLAWGALESSDRIGINIILVHSDTCEYGDWYLMKNTNSGFSRSERRPEPFAFSNDELVKEIHNIGATHIYSLRVSPLDVNELLEFISSSL